MILTKNQSNLISRLKQSIKKIPLIYRLYKKFKRILSFPKLGISFKRIILRFFKTSSLGSLLFKIIIFVLRRINFVSYADKYQKKYNNFRIDCNIVASEKFNNSLEKHYYLNPKAKSIFKDLIS